MLAVSLYCPFLIVPSVFSKVNVCSISKSISIGMLHFNSSINVLSIRYMKKKTRKLFCLRFGSFCSVSSWTWPHGYITVEYELCACTHKMTNQKTAYNTCSVMIRHFRSTSAKLEVDFFSWPKGQTTNVRLLILYNSNIHVYHQTIIALHCMQINVNWPKIGSQF